MADPLEAIGNIGQKMLSVPTDILSVGTRRVTEDMGMMTAKIQDIGTTLMPAGGLGLPQLPPLPGMPGTEQAAQPTPPRSESTGKGRTTKQTSYMRV